MNRLSAVLLSTLLACAALPAPAAPAHHDRGPAPARPPASHAPAAPAVAPARLAESYARLPLRFEANRGQADQRVRFTARGGGYALALTRDAAELKLSGGRGRRSQTLSMKLVGARAAARVEAEDEWPGVSHYLAGPDPARWVTGVPHHARVRYREVYPGVDLAFYGREGELEYDFVLAPGARPDLIRLRFEGARGARVEPGGDLVLRVAGGEVRQRRPFVYQQVGGERREVAGAFRLRRGEVTFKIGSYDPRLPLVIDPVLLYSTFLGGSQTDAAEAIVVDSAGQAHLAGYTASADFPGATTTLAGVYDAFVSKLSADGSNVLYTTYLGGAGDERAMGLALDASGNVYVTGRTDSADFPTTTGAYDPSHNGLTDAFVTKLNAAGTPVYSTYLGGDNFDNGDDTDFVARRTGEIAVDASGAAYVTGSTQSVLFPTVSAFQPAHGGGEPCRVNTPCADAFLTKLNPEGSALVYSTFLGGPDSDRGTGVDVDSAGRAYVTGYSWSRFPVSPGAFKTLGGGDAFVVKYDAGGGRLYSTYLGGSGSEDLGLNGPRVAADDAGHAYVTGDTRSSDFPTTPGAYQTAWGGNTDIFVSKLNPEGTALVFSTYIGGLGGEASGGIAVDSAANVYVSGSTGSGFGYPRVNPLPEDFASATSDAFLTKLNPTGTALVYSTVLGGHRSDDARDVALDGAGAAYVAGKTNSNGLNNGRVFPTTTGRPYAGGSLDAFVFKVNDSADPPVEPTPTPTPTSTPTPSPTPTPPARVNHALAANGAAATASSTLSANRTPLAVINGDRRGVHWDSDPATGSGWTDATQSAFPDWVEVAFAGEKSVDEVSVFTVQDNYTAPSAPTEAMTFTKYGATAYQVQYWTGSAWAQVTGASVTGNNRVWRKFTFAPLTTTKLRFVVTGGLTGVSRLTEVEAWGTVGGPPPRVNHALSSNGATASASSTLDSTRLPIAAINGDRLGLHWGSGPTTGSGWTDANANAFPDWLAVTFNGSKTITEISVFGLQDNYASPAEPTEAMTFTTYGLVDFDLEYWTGSAWAAVPGGAVRGNNKVWRRVTFAPLTTTKIRVVVRKALSNYSRVAEVEAY